MDSNTHSTGQPARLAALTAAVEELAAQNLDGLTDAVRAERVLGLRRLLDRLEGHWLQELAAVDARGAAGAEHDLQVGSTASWLRTRLRMGAGAAHRNVRTARALFRGPLTQTAKALTDGQLSPAHASVLAHGTYDLPHQVTAEAEPVLVDLDSLQGRAGSLGGDTELGPLSAETCRRLACDGAVTRVLVTRHPTNHHANQHPTDHHDHHGHSHQGPTGHDHHGHGDPGGRHHPGDQHHPGHDGEPGSDQDLTARLRTAAALLPPVLGGAPTQPLDVGRTTRVVQPAQRTALAVRDGGCVFPGCDRPLSWCEAHHLVHWLDGGPTDLDNLVLVCRAHHRAVHEGGWRLQHQPDGRLTATPPHRPHRRHHAAA
jgi:Domain of unknown function (DUF222)/HNH endonuclease